jgi:RNA polymerase sigma factor (sigma-70 family)
MMSEATWALLRRLFVDDYAWFSRKLERLTGSAELAEEALQETYVRLAQGGEIRDQLSSPQNYLLKMAINSARKILRKDRVRGRYIDLVELLGIEVADDAPGADRIVHAGRDILAVKAVLATMPERRRAIFLLALFDDLPLADIAQRYGIGVRMVQIELKTARDEIIDRMGGANVIDFANARPEGSKVREHMTDDRINGR